LYQMFYSAQKFDQPLNNWNTASVTNMAYTFAHADNFKGDVSTWDTSGVTNMSNMFQSTTGFSSDLNNWQTGNVTTFASMFFNSNFNQPIGNWDTSSCVSFKQMFHADNAFNQNIDTWNTSNVTEFREMFYQSGFNQDLSNWDMSAATNITGMFQQLPHQYSHSLGSWDLSSVTSMNNIFQGSHGMSTAAYSDTLREWALANDGIWINGFIDPTITSAGGGYNLDGNNVNGDVTYTNGQGWYMFRNPNGDWVISDTAYDWGFSNTTGTHDPGSAIKWFLIGSGDVYPPVGPHVSDQVIDIGGSNFEPVNSSPEFLNNNPMGVVVTFTGPNSKVPELAGQSLHIDNTEYTINDKKYRDVLTDRFQLNITGDTQI